MKECLHRLTQHSRIENLEYLPHLIADQCGVAHIVITKQQGPTAALLPRA